MNQLRVSLRLGALASLVATSALGCAATQERALSQAESASAGDALGAGIEDAAKTFGPVATAGADGGCVALVGDTSDADGDGIPADAKLTFDCSTTVFGLTGTLTGTEGVTDDQPDAIAWAFTGSADLHASLTGPRGASIVRDWSGQLVATQAAALGPFTLGRTLDATTVFTTATGTTTTVTENNDWSVSFTPSIAWTPGAVIVSGSLDAAGSWNVDVDGVGAEATLSTPTPLTLSPTCATRITAGTVRGTYEAQGVSHTIDVTWSGCGLHTVTST